MLKLTTVVTIMGCFVLTASTALADPVAPAAPPAATPVWTGEHYAKLREEVRLNENRARELEPIIARDRQARHDVEVDWIVLERHAREMHARANEFRQMAQFSTWRGAADLNRFAADLDVFATHDEENAHWQHEIGERLEHAVERETDVREQHLRMAQRIRDWLSGNGG
jgi:hypothetical protein